MRFKKKGSEYYTTTMMATLPYPQYEVGKTLRPIKEKPARRQRST